MGWGLCSLDFKQNPNVYERKLRLALWDFVFISQKLSYFKDITVVILSAGMFSFSKINLHGTKTKTKTVVTEDN